MKKLVSILLALTLLACLCACAKQPEPVPEEPVEAPIEETVPEELVPEEPEYNAEELAALDPTLMLGDWVRESATIDGESISDEAGFSCSLGITQDVTANFGWVRGEDTLEEYGLNIEFVEGQLLEDCPMPWFAELKNSAYGCTYQFTLTGHDSITLIQHRPLADGQGTQEIVVNFCRVEY